jgi:hypothetical protein
LKIDHLKDGQDILNEINLHSTTNFPVAIELGEKFEYKIPIIGLRRNFNEVGVKKIKSNATDTLEKQHYSNWFSIQE